jgi:membrane protease YdiL (CAAX protease family)
VSNGAEQPVNAFTVVDAVTIFGGVALFAWWLLTTSLGRESLARSKPRRNCMTPATPILLFLAWLLGGGLLLSLTLQIMGNAAPWQKAFWGQLASSIGSLGIVVIILILARLDFARGLKGLGLRLRTAPKDLGLAFLTLLAVWPLVLAAMSLTILVTRELSGHEYQVPQHEALKMMTEYPARPLQVLLVVMAVVVAPIVEEMLFRGLFQTTIRSYLQRPWPAIVLTSILFASVHPYASHWPSLFVLALGLGYSYEKSGSLLRSIFMHALFNGINVVGVLTQQPGWIY